MTNAQLCRRIIHLIHAPIHVYNTNGDCSNIYVDNGEQQDLLSCDPDFVRELLEKKQAEYPVLYLEAGKIIYGIVCDNEETYILDPCSLEADTLAMEKYLIRNHRLNPRSPYRISYVSLILFSELSLMVYEQLTGITLEIGELYLHCFVDKTLTDSMVDKVRDVLIDYRESETVHNPYSQEVREQEAIRTGNLEALEMSFHESFVGRWGTLSHDWLRHSKNMAIVLITLATRSAIEGGVLPEIAYSMSDGFIQRSEELNEAGTVLAMAKQAEVEFCKAVKELSKTPNHNPLVRRCKELVIQNLHSRITSQDLAEQLGITPSYLSRLFIKEEGIKLTDYIAKEKIEAAKQQIIYTQDSYSTIAYTLGFTSHGHFGKVFRKVTGMTPGEYREKYGRQ